MPECVCALNLYSLKMECDKLASEKSEMQRHYIMVRKTPSLSSFEKYLRHSIGELWVLMGRQRRVCSHSQ